jgi:hypothetical protein
MPENPRTSLSILVRIMAATMERVEKTCLYWMSVLGIGERREEELGVFVVWSTTTD